MKKNESNFKKALNELLGSGSEETSETQREPETDYRQTEESQEDQISEEHNMEEEHTPEAYDTEEPAAAEPVPEEPVSDSQLPEETASAAEPPVLSERNSDISAPDSGMEEYACHGAGFSGNHLIRYCAALVLYYDIIRIFMVSACQ